MKRHLLSPGFFRLLVFFFAAFSFANQADAQGAGPKKVMLVLDASGSMWGKIGDRTKIEIAREVIGGLVKDWNPQNQIGLSVYGHRQKEDCDDIQTLIPVGRLDPKVFMAEVNKVNPKGKTPLSQAVQLAAKDLRYTKDPATVILISDGKETCNWDPCKVGQDLEKSGVDFTAHVIGFDVAAKEEQDQLKCLAQNTGGEFLTAKDASSLKTALGKAVQTAVADKPGLKAKAYLAKGQEFISSGLWWEVFEAKEDINGKRKKLKYTNDPMPFFELEPGQYLLQAKYGNATAQHEIEVKGKETQLVELILQAGRVKAKGFLKDNGNPLESGNWWEVFNPEKDINSNRKKIAYTSDNSPLFTLPEGKFIISLKNGNAQREVAVQVKAGEDQILNLALNAGRVKCKGYLKKDSSPLQSGNWWEVFEAKEDINGNRKKIAYTSDNSPLFILPEGTYLLSLKNGQAQRNQEVTVQSNQDQVQDVFLDAGQLKVQAVSKKGGSPLDGGKWWEVFEAKEDINGKRKKITYTSDTSPLFILPEGSYLISVKSGDKNGTETISVKRGEAVKLDVVAK